MDAGDLFAFIDYVSDLHIFCALSSHIGYKIQQKHPSQLKEFRALKKQLSLPTDSSKSAKDAASQSHKKADQKYNERCGGTFLKLN